MLGQLLLRSYYNVTYLQSYILSSSVITLQLLFFHYYFYIYVLIP
jgi:hypothetical protein